MPQGWKVCMLLLDNVYLLLVPFWKVHISKLSHLILSPQTQYNLYECGSQMCKTVSKYTERVVAVKLRMASILHQMSINIVLFEW